LFEAGPDDQHLSIIRRTDNNDEQDAAYQDGFAQFIAALHRSRSTLHRLPQFTAAPDPKLMVVP